MWLDSTTKKTFDRQLGTSVSLRAVISSHWHLLGSSINERVNMKNVGWGIAVIFSIFMIVASAAPKLFGAEVAIQPLNQIGWTSKYIFLIGALELLFTVLFLIPRTALLGAILMTGLFGGALASHLRVDSPMFSHTLFSIYLGAFMWGSLYLRDNRVRTLF